MGKWGSPTAGCVWEVAILDPWAGAPGSLQEFSREAVHSVREFGHTMVPTREAIVSGVGLQERPGGVGHTCQHPGDTKPIAAPGAGNR